MKRFLINGPNKGVKGEINVSGAKNSCLPLMAASILFKKKVILRNAPFVKDVLTMKDLLISLGSKVELIKEKKIINILETKVRPAVAKDGGDIKFKEFKNGVVTVNLQGSCSGCPSSTMTLKQGVQNLLCHYIPEIKEVIAI